MNYLLPALFGLLAYIPVLGIWSIGCALALKNRKAFPQAAKAALIAFVLLIVSQLCSALVRILLPLLMHDQGYSNTQIGYLAAANNLLNILLSAIAWVLILAAIFGWRGQTAPTQVAQQLPPNSYVA